jgi:hypothetical protein
MSCLYSQLDLCLVHIQQSLLNIHRFALSFVLWDSFISHVTRKCQQLQETQICCSILQTCSMRQRVNLCDLQQATLWYATSHILFF